MASLVEDLIQVLEEETGCYELLLNVANNKKDVIIQGDVPSLQTMVNHEQELAGRLLRLEKKRQELINDIALVTNQDAQTLTVSKLIALLKGQDAITEVMRTTVENLTKQVEQVKEANDLNRKLIEQSLDFVDFTMNAIQSSKTPLNQSNYTNKRRGYESMGGRNFFDAKQ